MVNLKIIKTNWSKRKWDNNQNKPQPILAIYRGVVIVDFLDYIHVNKSFYTLKVRLWFSKEILSQAYINKEKCCNVTGRIAKRDDNSNIINKWKFKKILNVYNK